MPVAADTRAAAQHWPSSEPARPSWQRRPRANVTAEGYPATGCRWRHQLLCLERDHSDAGRERKGTKEMENICCVPWGARGPPMDLWGP